MAKTATTDTPTGIKLSGIELLSSSLSRPEIVAKDQTAFLFGITLMHDIAREKKLIFVIATVTIKSLEEKKDVGSISVSLIFEIENFEEVVTILDEKNFKLTEALKDVLNSISISTTRGVMFSTFKGTYLHNALLPIVDPRQLICDKQ
jgi:hypothetical protein